MPLVPGGTMGSELAVALVPGDGLYAARVRIDGTPGVHGATLSSAGTWSAIDDLGATGSMRVRAFAADDGELTVLWQANDGNGNFTLTSRRRAAGASTFAAEVPVSAPQTTFYDAAIDASGNLTVLRANGTAIFHHRIAKGATAWSPPVRVDGMTYGGTEITLAIEPTTGDPLAAWLDEHDLTFARCH